MGTKKLDSADWQHQLQPNSHCHMHRWRHMCQQFQVQNSIISQVKSFSMKIDIKLHAKWLQAVCMLPSCCFFGNLLKKYVKLNWIRINKKPINTDLIDIIHADKENSVYQQQYLKNWFSSIIQLNCVRCNAI